MGQATWFKVFGRASDVLDVIPNENVGEGLKTALHYLKDGVEPENLTSLSLVAFALFRGDIDTANREFETRSERNRRNIQNRYADTTTDYNSLPVVTSGNDSLRLGGKLEVRSKNPESFSLGDESPKPRKTNRFVPPTLDEVSDYCRERGNSIDPQQFLDHYEASGWTRGKTKIKDWRACVRTWEKNETPSTTGNETYHTPVYMGQDENGRGIYA